MKKSVEKTMHELRRDHRNMALLLDALDVETQRLDENASPDYAMVDEIMRYMSEYSDAVHHPKEDMIYRYIYSDHPEIEAALKHIESDHVALAAATLHIQRELDALVPDEVPDHSSLATALRKYSQDLRTHMYWEEKELFALADAMQDNNAWRELLRNSDTPRDPLFGNRVEKKYKRLLGHIQQRVVWSKEQTFT